MIGIEQLTDALISQVQGNFAAQLVTVLNEQGTDVQIWPPQLDSYFIGEPHRYRSYECPALFVTTDRTTTPGVASGTGWNQDEFQHHSMRLIAVIEGQTENELMRGCWRVAEVLKACLHDQELFVPNVSVRTCKAFVTAIDYGVFWTRAESAARPFRRDISLMLLVKHWDRFLPMATSPGGDGPTTSETSTIVANATDTLLTTTDATQVVNYTTGTDTNNYLVYVYYRVITAATDVTLTLQWTDGTGVQSSTIVTGSQPVGSYTIPATFISAIGGTGIAVTATAGTANQVYVSAAIEELGT